MNESGTAFYDVVIIGGGVAALWTANALKSAGLSVLVLSNTPLGTAQSLAAQGVIHGGLKYAVAGKLTDSSETLADMPSRWLKALRGDGPVDLSSASILSDHQVLWTQPGLLSQAAGFFGSKAMRGRSEPLRKEDYPDALESSHYRGKAFRIEEPVVDPISVLSALSAGLTGQIHLVDWNTNAALRSRDSRIEAIELTLGDETELRVEASHYVLAAGAGNGPILEQLSIPSPRMQLRPLHQVIIRAPHLPNFYSVCVGTGPKPPIVVTTHHDSKGRAVWYVGGDLAEKEGVARSEKEQIIEAKATFARLMPWIDLSEAEWFTWRGNRAEPKTGTGDRPPGAFCEQIENVLVTWPTKLALAPDLGDEVVRRLGSESGNKLHPSPTPLSLPQPGIGKPPWDLP